MRFLNKAYHFLGSVYCAITLILIVALYVVLGTFLESSADSHLYAASFTYQHPVFLLLLTLFFINILFSALRRWPFQWHHVPFLVTHLGLLMIISGIMVKNFWGLQGTMGILEGAASDTVFLPETYVLHLEKKNPKNIQKNITQEWPLKFKLVGGLSSKLKQSNQKDLFPEVDFHLNHFEPHGKEFFDTWIKQDYAVIVGLPPLPIYEWNEKEHGGSPLPISSYIKIGSELCEVCVFQTDDVKELAERAYLDKKPRLVLANDSQGDTFLFAFDKNGKISYEEFIQDQLAQIVVYDRGFGGYAIQAELPEGQIETPITFRHKALPLTKKWEDHTPLISLNFSRSGITEKVTLAYNKYGTGLKRPILNGNYLVRFQPQFHKIPYRLRLRDARQINYPGANQASNYECDLVITDLNRNQKAEVTLSMNNVHQTWDGYRFYLANISPSDESSVKRVQIIVNYDPVKYILTYPGGFLVAAGILMLFWLFPYKQQ